MLYEVQDLNLTELYHFIELQKREEEGQRAGRDQQ